jgi:hypothetical protein
MNKEHKVAVNSEFSLFYILLLLCAGQGLFLAHALIFSKTNNWLANRYLGIFTLAITLTVADALCSHHMGSRFGNAAASANRDNMEHSSIIYNCARHDIPMAERPLIEPARITDKGHFLLC